MHVSKQPSASSNSAEPCSAAAAAATAATAATTATTAATAAAAAAATADPGGESIESTTQDLAGSTSSEEGSSAAPSQSSAWATGARLHARDCRELWCEASVVATRGAGLTLELLVHYKGWKKKWDEWLLARGPRVRPLPEDYEVKRGRSLELLQVSSAAEQRAEAAACSAAAANLRATAHASCTHGASAATSSALPTAAGSPASSRATSSAAMLAAQVAADAAAAAKSAAKRALKALPGEQRQLLQQEAMAAAEAAEAAAAVARWRAEAASAEAAKQHAAAVAEEAAEGDEQIGGNWDQGSAADVPPRQDAGRGRGCGGGSSRGRGRRAAGAPSAADAVGPEQPSVQRGLSDGDRVRADWEQFDDGDYERCGVYGCILANKHSGLHVCPEVEGGRRKRLKS